MTERLRCGGRSRQGYSLLELVVSVAVASIVLLALSRFFMNYYTSFKETQMRLRMQRDMRTLSYWVKKDLTALAQRTGNVDLKNPGSDFAFLAADDSTDTSDFSTNTSDNGLDTFTYTFSDNVVTRTWYPGGTMASKVTTIALEALDFTKGDTLAVNITLHDKNDSTVLRSQFNATLGDFDYTTRPIRRVDVQLIFSKRPQGSMFLKRPAILERAEIIAVALYRRGA